jgi:hypothetical protein
VKEYDTHAKLAMFEHFTAIRCILVHHDSNHECARCVVEQLKLKGQLWGKKCISQYKNYTLLLQKTGNL